MSLWPSWETMGQQHRLSWVRMRSPVPKTAALCTNTSSAWDQEFLAAWPVSVWRTEQQATGPLYCSAKSRTLCRDARSISTITWVNLNQMSQGWHFSNPSMAAGQPWQDMARRGAGGGAFGCSCNILKRVNDGKCTLKSNKADGRLGDGHQTRPSWTSLPKLSPSSYPAPYRRDRCQLLVIEQHLKHKVLPSWPVPFWCIEPSMPKGW